MYEDRVLEHYANPFHQGENPCGYTHRGAHRGDACGDEVHLELFVSSWGIISRFYWTGEGCCFSQAAASMLARRFELVDLGDVEDFTEEDMFNLFAAEVPSARKGCVLTAFHALKHLETVDAKA
jgi:nitrogen fixation NifU-like protein